MNVSVKVGWIPGHTEIQQNKLDNHEAKTMASRIAHGAQQADAVLSIPVAIKVGKELSPQHRKEDGTSVEKGNNKNTHAKGHAQNIFPRE